MNKKASSRLLTVLVGSCRFLTVIRVTAGKTRINGKTAKIPERLKKNNREILMDASANCEKFYLLINSICCL